jgi:A/G-specific adenine glycosylase
MQGSETMHEAIVTWYRANARELPWRAPDRTPWGVLVSEVMLQQTPVARVEPVWRDWMARWPQPADLADESPGEVIRAWGRLGYPRRALRMRASAQSIVTHHSGRVPDSYSELRELPGIGDYTAAAVAAFAFGQRHPVLDTNVRRVLARAVAGTALPASSTTAGERRQAEALLPDDRAAAAEWSVAVMELGALVCTARAPRCPTCPVAAMCEWRKSGQPSYSGPPRRAQPWAGTDRQVRGRIMAVLRDTAVPVSRARLDAVWPDDPAQFERALDSLVADGLVTSDGSGYQLPTG